MSVVYFVQAGAGGPIKIGIAGDITARLAALQTGCPDFLSVLATIEGGRKEEERLHTHLRQHRLRGEWFRPAPAVLEAAELARSGRYPEAAQAEDDGGQYFSHVQNVVGWVRCRVKCQGWSACRLAVEAGLHRNTLLGCERDDWNPTYSTLLALEVCLRRLAARDRAAA